MGNFFAELKRRHIYRVAAAYVVVAWLALQLVNNLAPVFELPNWIARAMVLLLAIGFPVALVLAWVSELKSPSADAVKTKHTPVDWILAGALLAVIALIAYDRMVATQSLPPPEASATPATPALHAGISIAVLPFANLSGDAGQEFFSDGMTEEIMTALAKIATLRVVGRESAFQFKSAKLDMRAVGQALSAAYLIEGSVRKAGDRVRITAQLVKADDGVSVWTDSYDRELKDIFATQSDIAQSIAVALRVPLGLQPGASLVSNRNIDPENYQIYLRASSMIRNRLNATSVTAAIGLLEQVVARDPDYAPGLARLAVAHSLVLGNPDLRFKFGSVEEMRRLLDNEFGQADTAAHLASQRDANLAEPYLALALGQHVRGKLLAAEEFFQKALALDPANPETISFYASLLADLGRVKEGLAMKQSALMLEPYVPVFRANTGFFLAVANQDDAAITMLRAVGNGSILRTAQTHAFAGRFGEAADTLLTLDATQYPPGAIEEAARVLRNTAASTNSSFQGEHQATELDFVYLYTAAPERMLELYEHALEAGYPMIKPIDMAAFWHSSAAALRRTERFKTFIRKAGLVDYWKERGWPDVCRPKGANDIECY